MDQHRAAMSKLSTICAHRARLWGLVGTLIAGPDRDWFEQLSNGSITAQFRELASSLGWDMMQIQRPITQLHQALKAGFAATDLVELFPAESGDLLVEIHQLQTLTTDEGRAWAAAEADRAKALRIAHVSALHKMVYPALLNIIRALQGAFPKSAGPGPKLAALSMANMLTVLVSIESGHDVEAELKKTTPGSSSAGWFVSNI